MRRRDWSVVVAVTIVAALSSVFYWWQFSRERACKRAGGMYIWNEWKCVIVAGEVPL